jgi:hypothetical protein
MLRVMKFLQCQLKGAMEVFLDWQGIMDPEIIPEDNTVKEMNQVFTCLW